MSPGGQKKIFVHFKDLYVNRVRFEGNKKPVKSVTVEIDVPKVSKKSQKLAQNHRDKIIAQQPGSVAQNIEHFLLTKDIVKSKAKEEKARTIKSAKQLEDERELTLAPKTNKFVHKLDQYKP